MFDTFPEPILLELTPEAILESVTAPFVMVKVVAPATSPVCVTLETLALFAVISVACVVVIPTLPVFATTWASLASVNELVSALLSYLVFIDADKSNYVNYFHLIIDKMNAGGIILSDNVLWSGKVVEELNPKDKDTKVLLDYNKLLNIDARIETVLLPIRDGLTVSRVK